MSATGIAQRLRAPWTRRESPAAPSRRPPLALDEAVAGEEVTTAQGRFFRTRDVRPARGKYGGEVLRAFAAVRPSSLAFLTADATLASFEPHRAVFLDTETTGLAGGTGTYAFLVGLGFFQGERFVIEQYFMRSFGEERAMMAHVAERIAEFPGVVTFNGRGFDLPLLQTRFIMSRQRRAAARLEAWTHLDLLPAARHLWREALPNCKLSSLEAAVLGVRRHEECAELADPEYLPRLRAYPGRPPSTPRVRAQPLRHPHDGRPGQLCRADAIPPVGAMPRATAPRGRDRCGRAAPRATWADSTQRAALCGSAPATASR